MDRHRPPKAAPVAAAKPPGDLLLARPSNSQRAHFGEAIRDWSQEQGFAHWSHAAILL